MYTTYHSRKQIREKSKIRYIYVILGKGNYRENVLTFTDRKGTPSNSRALMINDDDEDENDDEKDGGEENDRDDDEDDNKWPAR